MKYLLIADHPASLPFAVSIDEQTIEDATSKVTSMELEQGYINALFLIDLEAGEAKRLVRDGEGWMLSDTAFDQLGAATPDEYFEEGTMEMNL